jgi:hypothetical protein
MRTLTQTGKAEMMLTRRVVLGGTAALAAGLGTCGARASAPLIGKQAPGFYRYTVGSIEVTVINDGLSRMPITDGFVSNVPKDDVNAVLAALFMEKDFYAGPYNPIVINTGSKLAIVDTGTGEAAYKAL